MKRLVAAGASLALVGALALAQPIRLLIVDQTTTMEESLRIAAFARALRATGYFTVKALTELPKEHWTEEPFLFVIIVPSQGRFIWLCTPAPAQYLPDPLPEVYAGLVQGLHQAFSSQREARGSGQDLYPFLLSLELQRLGLLVGVGAP